MKNAEIQSRTNELSPARLRRWLTVALLGTILVLAGCSESTDKIYPSSETTTKQILGTNDTGKLDVTTNILNQIVGISIVEPSSICEPNNNQQRTICSSIDLVTSALNYSPAETEDIKRHVFEIDQSSFEALYPGGATGLTVGEAMLFPPTANHGIDNISHELAHREINVGQALRDSTGNHQIQFLGLENLTEDMQVAKVEDQTATVCKQNPDGSGTCRSSKIPELNADIFASVTTAIIRGCTSSTWTIDCGVGGYSGYIYDKSDMPGALSIMETRTYMNTARMYYLDNPGEFQAWVQMLKSGDFAGSWQQTIKAFNLTGVSPEQALNTIMNLDISINLYSGRSDYLSSNLTVPSLLEWAR